MGIQVTCPNGHLLNVKSKYAGKTGRCPICKATVTVPSPLTDDDIVELIGEAPKSDPGANDSSAMNDQRSVLDDEQGHVDTSGISLIGGSAVRHMKSCPTCHEEVPYWFATCPQCKAEISDDLGRHS